MLSDESKKIKKYQPSFITKCSLWCNPQFRKVKKALSRTPSFHSHNSDGSSTDTDSIRFGEDTSISSKRVEDEKITWEGDI